MYGYMYMCVYIYVTVEGRKGQEESLCDLFAAIPRMKVIAMPTARARDSGVCKV